MVFTTQFPALMVYPLSAIFVLKYLGSYRCN